ncbi:zinc fingers and homeoboxes protein 3 [Python bivittatus]|uniref:Zinc fingers and homeoboxes protein 3 n=1 Tax=Python bivittatus TaxID=176946 RepID=A0A9F5N0R2_PYTBI|nr:zinc fingers and homeoboxes protein 3 [Python bivittatus]XP_025023753.1 zinc fingers and homeoboxes protein 3 [Python bivittatus]XP_025023754.1 zinc fingers and homeoboxes protein 3 [Python bivittatus]XP_025023755.1 zinc fingers and homeoboxes protein 3 [Python bivittatus]
MASKRKSTTPCMIPAKMLAPQKSVSASVGVNHEEAHKGVVPVTLPNCDTTINNHSSETLSNGHNGILDSTSYRCTCCDFTTQEVNQFLSHLDSEHTDFSKDPSFLCVKCSFLVKNHNDLSRHNAEHHAGETNLSWNVVKQADHMIVEQTTGNTSSGSQDHLGDTPEEGQDSQAEIIITKMPIMKIMRTKPEVKKIHTLKENVSSKSVKDVETKGELSFTNGAVPVSQSVKLTPVINGSVVGNVPVLQAGITQLVQLQQQAQVHQHLPTSKSLPKVMIPLSSIPTYNAAMDSNSFLKNSFHKFPYPTKAELCYLTVVTKYPEEQLKIWFTAQRLKQGISWSPEEIEDARKKMFNTVIQSVPQSTITVLNTPLVASPSSVQHLIQASLPGHSVGKPEGASGMLVTQPIITNGLQGTTSSHAIAVTSIPKTQIAKPPTTVSVSSIAPTVNVVSAAQSQLSACPNISSQAFLDPNLFKNKKSYEQLSALKDSFCRNQFPGQTEVERLTKITGLSTRDVRKWFSDRRYHCRNVRGSKPVLGGDSTIIIDSVPEITFTTSPKTTMELTSTSAATPVHTPARRQSWHQAPDFSTAKYKERAPEQLRALESSFAQNPFPLEEEVDRLRSETKMTRREIDSWFSEQRKRQVIKETKQPADEDAEDESIEEEDDLDDLRVSGENGSLDAAGSSQIPGERKVTPIKINLRNFKVTESNGKSELAALGAHAIRENSPSRAQKPRLSFKKTAQQRHLLKQLFIKTQRPTNEQYDQICCQTGLPRVEVIRWFGDSRYGLKNGNLRWYENYKKGIFPKGLSISSEVSQEILQDYFQKNKVLYEDDLLDLCERTQMTTSQVRLWFAERLGEESKAVSDAGSDGQSSSVGDPANSQKGTFDTFSEISENSESWEPGGQDGSSEFGDADSHLPAIHSEMD